MAMNLKKAYKHAAFHRVELLASKACGCFSCLKVYSPEVICNWTDKGKTAICPYCGLNAVIGDASRYPINDGFLNDMKKYFVS